MTITVLGMPMMTREVGKIIGIPQRSLGLGSGPPYSSKYHNKASQLNILVSQKKKKKKSWFPSAYKSAVYTIP